VSKPTDTKTVFDQIVEQIDGDASGSAPSAANGPELQTPPRLDAKDRSPDDESTEGDNIELEPGEDTDSAQTEARDLPSKRSRIRHAIRRVAPLAGGIIVVGALASSAFFGWQLKQRIDTAAAGHAALETARDYAATLSSVDSRDVDKNFVQVLDGATGEFKSMYSQASTQLRQLLVDNKAVSHGMVADAAVKSATKSKVEVLLFLDQSITNAVNPDPRVDRLRMVMTMERVDKHWLLSKLEIE
jgi:Mce-associated membrane protein